MGIFSTAKNVSQAVNQEVSQTQSQSSGVRKVGEYEGSSSSTGRLEVEKTVEQIIGKTRPKMIVDIVQKGDELSEEDLEILEAVQQSMEEEQKEAIPDVEPEQFLGGLSKCYITGCQVHTFYPHCIHYGNTRGGDLQRISDMGPRLKRGYELYKKNPGCSHVDIYERHFCVVALNGTTTVINE